MLCRSATNVFSSSGTREQQFRNCRLKFSSRKNRYVMAIIRRGLETLKLVTGKADRCLFGQGWTKSNQQRAEGLILGVNPTSNWLAHQLENLQDPWNRGALFKNAFVMWWPVMTIICNFWEPPKLMGGSILWGYNFVNQYRLEFFSMWVLCFSIALCLISGSCKNLYPGKFIPIRVPWNQCTLT